MRPQLDSRRCRGFPVRRGRAIFSRLRSGRLGVSLCLRLAFDAFSTSVRQSLRGRQLAHGVARLNVDFFQDDSHGRHVFLELVPVNQEVAVHRRVDGSHVPAAAARPTATRAPPIAIVAAEAAVPARELPECPESAKPARICVRERARAEASHAGEDRIYGVLAHRGPILSQRPVGLTGLPRSETRRTTVSSRKLPPRTSREVPGARFAQSVQGFK